MCVVVFTLQDCTFSTKFKEHIDNFHEVHEKVNVIYGYNLNFGRTKVDSMDILKEGLECLRDFCKENNVSLVELFERFDADNSMSVSLQEFQEGLKVRLLESYSLKLPLRSQLINFLNIFFKEMSIHA